MGFSSQAGTPGGSLCGYETENQIAHCGGVICREFKDVRALEALEVSVEMVLRLLRINYYTDAGMCCFKCCI